MSAQSVPGATHLCIVIFPNPPRNLVAAQIKCLEVDARHLQLLQAAGAQAATSDAAALGAALPVLNCVLNFHHASTPSTALWGIKDDMAHLCPALQLARTSDVGYCVGWCCASRSSLSMCIRVVLPALSRPRNRIFAFLFAA